MLPLTAPHPASRLAQLPAAAAGSTLTRVELEAARQTLERIYQSGSAGTLTGGASAGSRALGVLVQGLGVALGAAGFWLAMEQPAGLPVLHETLITGGPDGFFDRLEGMLAENGGDPGAADALRSTVMGFLAEGRVHSAGVVLGEALAHLQQGGLISRNADARGLAFDAVLNYAQRHPETVRPQTQATTVERPPVAVAPPLTQSPQPPALSAEIQALRADIATGRYANSQQAYDQGVARLGAVIDDANGLRAQGVQTFGADAVQVAQTELSARRYNSVLTQYQRNAESGGPLPDLGGLRGYLNDVRAFDAAVQQAYGRPVFGDAALSTIEQRLTAAIELRGEFTQFLHQVRSGGYANSTDAYAAGAERLEALRLEANEIAANHGVVGITQADYQRATLELEARRLNSVLAQTFRYAEAGREVDVDHAAALIERAQQHDAEAQRLTGDTLFDAGALDAYRDALARLQSTEAELPSRTDLPSLPEPVRLPGGDDVQRVAEEYGVSPHDVVRVMQDNPGMSPEQAAQYLKAALLAAPTGGNAPQLPPAPPNGGDATATATSPEPDEPGASTDATQGADAPQLPSGFDRTLNVLQPGDLGFRTSADSRGTNVVFQEFIGPRADYDRARWDALGYRLHDSWTPQTGWITYVSDRRSGEVIGYAANTRLANAGDRLQEVVNHQAGQIIDPVKREAYVKKWRDAINVVLDPTATRGAPNEIQNNVRRLGEAIQAEAERIRRGGAGEEIILPPSAQPENRRPQGGFDFVVPERPPNPESR